jgi:hypothetical protein
MRCPKTSEYRRDHGKWLPGVSCDHRCCNPGPCPADGLTAGHVSQAGLAARSRRPKISPNAISDHTVEPIIRFV